MSVATSLGAASALAIEMKTSATASNSSKVLAQLLAEAIGEPRFRSLALGPDSSEAQNNRHDSIKCSEWHQARPDLVDPCQSG